MNTKEKITVLVRATPEKSIKYGYKVCVAGINELGEWRRLYPFKFMHKKNIINFKKKDVIEVELTKPENDKRKESRKVISHKNLNIRQEDSSILKKILPLVTSIEKLNNQKASLGVIKPILSDIDIKINDTKIYDEQQYLSLTEKSLEKREKVKMPIELRYRFKCKNEPNCKGHKIILIDWELNELTRNILKKETNIEVIRQKIKDKFYDFMLKRDLYFFIGNHFRFKTWLIVGLFYPKFEISEQKKISEFNKSI